MENDWRPIGERLENVGISLAFKYVANAYADIGEVDGSARMTAQQMG